MISTWTMKQKCVMNTIVSVYVCLKHSVASCGQSTSAVLALHQMVNGCYERWDLCPRQYFDPSETIK